MSAAMTTDHGSARRGAAAAGSSSAMTSCTWLCWPDDAPVPGPPTYCDAPATSRALPNEQFVRAQTLRQHDNRCAQIVERIFADGDFPRRCAVAEPA